MGNTWKQVITELKSWLKFGKDLEGDALWANSRPIEVVL